MRNPTGCRLGITLLAVTLGLSAPREASAYTNFEGHQIHPLEITPGGGRLLALNTPDARLAIFALGPAGELSLQAEVPVGLEPVSVRARSDAEAWVVNHVSDTISIVDLTPGQERVVRTLKTDDEPSDVVFAGSGAGRAFVSISQRNRVDVYDAASPTTPLFQIEVDGEDPRALARNAAGTEVYAAVFHSGNRTLVVSGESFDPAEVNPLLPELPNRVNDPAGPYGGGPVPPPPGYDPLTPPFDTRPKTSVIAKWRDCTGGPQPEWCDDNDSSWDAVLESAPNTPVQMPDRDVAILDADAVTPGVQGYVTSVGTLNFGIAVRPGSGELYVSTTDARNHVRFELGTEIAGDGKGNDDGICDPSEPADACLVSLRGHLVDTRLTVASAGAVTGSVDLNPHIDYAAPITAVDGSLSLGQPNGMAFDAAGSRLYAAALLSRKVAVVDTSVVPGALLARIDVGEGPTGVALAEGVSRLYVLNRFENTISRVDTATNTEIPPRQPLYNPEPPAVTAGRRLLYDGQDTSGRGDVACATCHAFGGLDLLGWDLGDPTKTTPDPRPPQTPTPEAGASECGNSPDQPGCGPFDPLKGPRTTQTLQAILGTEPFHWHGDRGTFQDFNVAFPGLLMNPAPLASAEIDALADFVGTLAFPPNPNRALDDSPVVMDLDGDPGTPETGDAAAGAVEYSTVNRDAGSFTCNDCHSLPTGTNGRFAIGNADLVHQAMKVPQLRNLYEKTGFALHPDPAEPVPATTRNGFGFIHDGEVDDLVTFLSAPVFTFVQQGDAQELLDMVAFMLQFPTGQHAAVGHQITFDGANNGDAALLAELDDVFAGLDAGALDLVVSGVFGGLPRSFQCTALGASQASCQPDRAGDPALDAIALSDLAAGGAELTFTAVPAGFGARMGLDRDEDGFWNQTEIDAGSDPADPSSTPGPPSVPALGLPALLVGFALLVGHARRARRGVQPSVSRL